MSHLANLKDRLKLKPEVRPNEGVRVVMGKKEEPHIGVLTKPIIHKDLVEADINLIKSLILEKIKSNQI